MNHIRLVLALSALSVMLQACAWLQNSDGIEPNQASIAFADQRSAVISWQPDGRNGLWVQAGNRQWYYARFLSPCIGLPNTVRVAFVTGASNQLDRFSHVVIPNEAQRCSFISFIESDSPPDGKRHTPDGEEVS